MSQKLYVGNLCYSINEADLEELFERSGKVETSHVIRDPVKKYSRGFGFVTMESKEAAEKAISDFHGKEENGRKLVVNFAREPENRRGRNFRRHREFPRKRTHARKDLETQ